MRRPLFRTVVVCATLLCAGAALATSTPQENCDKARVTAWKTYVSCVDTVIAKDVGCWPNVSCPASFDEFAAFAKCRHTYFKQWALFQLRSTTTLKNSTCIGSRFASTDSGTTVTDNLSGLVWEKKTGTVGGGTDSNPENVNNFYAWGTGSNKEDGAAFTSFLRTVNSGGGFAGANGWRLPTIAELQTSLKDFACTGAGGGPTCTCGSPPCIDATFGPTQSFSYWSATRYVPDPLFAWVVYFDVGDVNIFAGKSGLGYVRAVRGGL